jgi:hypothetical protein
MAVQTADYIHDRAVNVHTRISAETKLPLIASREPNITLLVAPWNPSFYVKVAIVEPPPTIICN